MAFNVSEEEQRYYAEKEMKKRKEAALKKRTEAERAELRTALADVVKIDDDDVLDDIIALGFDETTVGVLPLVPLIAVAWADGEVQTREREAILELAEKRGVEKDSPAYTTLDGLLNDEPTSEYLHSCIYVLREIYESLAPQQTSRAKRNLVNFSRVVAEASGGLFGLFGNKVSDEEENLIDEIADWLGVNESEHTDAVHEMVSGSESETEEDGDDAKDED